MSPMLPEESWLFVQFVVSVPWLLVGSCLPPQAAVP